MTSSRPYLIRAIYQWLLDNEQTPHLLVDVSAGACDVPEEFVQDGRIVLNLAPGAVNALSLGDDRVDFDARFGGRPRHVSVPVAAVLAMYSRENGQGMMFPPDDDPGEPDGGGAPGPRPGLRVVK